MSKSILRLLWLVGFVIALPASAVHAGTFPLYLADGQKKTVYKFDSAGTATVFADDTDGLNFPTGVAVDATGVVYISEVTFNKVWRFTAAHTGPSSQTLPMGSLGHTASRWMDRATSSFRPILAVAAY
jgi:hypothetical protein